MPGIYIDIHTHSERKKSPEVISVRNILLQDARVQTGEVGYFSVGLHPWDTANVFFDKELAVEHAGLPLCLAIGECGLDRMKGADLTVQTTIFIQQALLAEHLVKPLIIHCVQAWEEIIRLKKEISPGVPWIIHGFRSKPETATRLIEHGFYLSFAESILKSIHSAKESLRITPVHRLFLETDESRLTIEEIYHAASMIKDIPLSDLQAGLEKNFEKVSGIHGTSRMASANRTAHWK